MSSALAKLLEQDASSYKWVAATEGSTAAAPLELATGDAVMSIGGFNGTDPWPTLAVFKQLVASHEIHYYVGQGSQSFGGGRGSSAIAVLGGGPLHEGDRRRPDRLRPHQAACRNGPAVQERRVNPGSPLPPQSPGNNREDRARREDRVPWG